MAKFIYFECLARRITNWKTAAVAAICSAAKFPGDKTNSRLSALSPLSIPVSLGFLHLYRMHFVIILVVFDSVY